MSGQLDSIHVGHHVIEVVEGCHVVVHRQTQFGQPAQGLQVGGRFGPIDHLTQLVGPEREVACGRHRCILLAKRPGRCVAGVDVGLLPGHLLSSIQRFKGREAQVDLTAYLQHRRRPVGEAFGDVRDGADVGRDVLTHLPGTSGGCLCK